MGHEVWNRRCTLGRAPSKLLPLLPLAVLLLLHPLVMLNLLCRHGR